MKLTMPRALRLPRRVLTGHPSTDTLARYAAGEPTEAMEDARADRARVAKHLVRCAECRAEVAFRRGLRDALHRLPEPDAPDALLARVLADRQQGSRVILPDAWLAERRRGRGRLVAGLVAASVVLATWLRPRGQGGTNAPADDWFVSTGMFVGAAAAQVPVRNTPRLAPAGPVAGERLHPFRLAYAAQWTDAAGQTRFDGRISIKVDSAFVAPANVRAWHLTMSWSGQIGDAATRTETETMVVRRDDLRPITRDVRVTPYNRNYRWLSIAQRFSDDSVLGQMMAEGTDGHSVARAIKRRLPADGRPYVTDALAPVFLTGIEDLAPGWARRVSVAGWAVVPNDLAYEVTMRVVGEERITTTAGTFDCWRLSIIGGSRVLDYWVRKRDGVAVRSRDATPRPDREGRTRGVREMVLVEE